MNIIEENILVVSYPVMEHFYTIQGEGKYAGRAAYFIRLGGCDVGCVWCDVKESWDANMHPKITVQNLLNVVLDSTTELVVITGGEPAMYDLSPLVNILKSNQIEVAIETSGAHELKGDVNWYTFSPKKFKAPVLEAYSLANELKIVVFNKHDFEWAEEHARKTNNNCLLYLQPEWSKKDEMTPMIVDYVKKHPKWKISLQTHKYINIP